MSYIDYESRDYKSYQAAPETDGDEEGSTMKKVYALGAMLVATLALFACSGQGSPQMDQTASLKPEPTPTATPRSQNSEIVIPVAPKVVDYQVKWTDALDGFDPFTIPVEKGLFNGNMSNLGWGATEIPGGRAYALKVYPDLKDALSILVAVSRDPVDNDVVLLSVFANLLDRSVDVRIALTVDGEKSWCNLNVLPYKRGDAGATRVTILDEEIHSYGRDGRGGSNWWEATVNKSELPCS